MSAPPHLPCPDPEGLHEVAAATQRWIQAFNAGKAARICALYHREAVLWGTTAPSLITTPQGLQRYFEGHCAVMPPPAIRLDAQRVRVYGSVAINTGSYTLHTGGTEPQRALSARFSFTYFKVGSDWLIVDHHSSFVPA